MKRAPPPHPPFPSPSRGRIVIRRSHHAEATNDSASASSATGAVSTATRTPPRLGPAPPRRAPRGGGAPAPPPGGAPAPRRAGLGEPLARDERGVDRAVRHGRDRAE